MPSTIVILGTGGTIAGTATDPADHTGYRAAQRSVAELLQALPALAGLPLEAEQVAQLDSKDMDHATWQRLAQRADFHLARPEVVGLVVTHGTDTLEETAWFLQRVLAPTKPLVLTAAMRPATALQADGPQNLLDAMAVAREPGAGGVLVVVAGSVHAAHDVRKRHTYRLAAFDSGDAGALAVVEQGRLRRFRAWPAGQALGLECIAADPAAWPRVEIVTSHAGAGGDLVDALLGQGVRGLVVAGTGNGSVHKLLEAALQRAVASGVVVWRSTRCAEGAIVAGEVAGGGPPQILPAATTLSPWQARIELMLGLLGGPVGPATGIAPAP